ncbi:hypothetical protein FB45DRAFT_935395, partial [Roridomyces roridus]
EGWSRRAGCGEAGNPWQELAMVATMLTVSMLWSGHNAQDLAVTRQTGVCCLISTELPEVGYPEGTPCPGWDQYPAAQS